MNILFVCHGNICRSPLAERVFRQMVASRGLQEQFPLIESAAVSREEIGNPIYPPMRRVLEAHGISSSGHSARQVTLDDYSRFDKIIVMDRSNLWYMQRLWGTSRMDKVSMLLDRDVADPWYSGDFEETWEDVVCGCEKLLESCVK